MSNRISKQFIKKLIASSQKAENLHALRIARALEDEMQYKVLETERQGYDFKELDMRLTSLRALKSIHQANQAIYQHGLNDLVDELAKYVKFAPSYGNINAEDQARIAAITQHTITNLNGIASNMKAPLIDAIQAGRDLGEGHLKIARRVQTVFQSDRVAADRFARTEGNYVINQAHSVKMQEAGMTSYEYIAVNDNRTSELCRLLDGTIFEFDDPDAVIPPAHFFCRSRIVANFEGIPGERDYTKPTTGEDFTAEEVDAEFQKLDTFKTKYWNLPDF